MIVRAATLGDLERLVALYEQLAEDRPDARPGPVSVAARVLEDIAIQSGRSLLVAEVEGTAPAEL